MAQKALLNTGVVHCGGLVQPAPARLADLEGQVEEINKSQAATMARRADVLGQLAAIDKAQAVITFELDGTIRGVMPRANLST